MSERKKVTSLELFSFHEIDHWLSPYEKGKIFFTDDGKVVALSRVGYMIDSNVPHFGIILDSINSYICKFRCMLAFNGSIIEEV